MLTQDEGLLQNQWVDAIGYGPLDNFSPTEIIYCIFLHCIRARIKMECV